MRPNTPILDTAKVKLFTNLRDGSVVPNVAFMRENVGNKSQLALLHILLNRVQKVFCGNLKRN